MRNLIILCAGGRTVGEVPLYLCTHPSGRIIADIVLEGIFPETYDRIIYTVLQSDVDQFNADDIIRNRTSQGNRCEILPLKEKTDGPATTVCQTIEGMRIKGEVAVRDSLGKMRLKKPAYGSFIAGLDLLSFTDSVQRLKEKGFILVNEQNKVLDFFEKRLTSDVISTGFYGFDDADDYVEFYRKIENGGYGFSRLSVGHVISYMIGYGDSNFWCLKSDEFEDWGDLQAWYSIQRKYATVFVNLDKVNPGYDIGAFDRDFIKNLEMASAKGLAFIFFYSDEKYNKVDELKQFLEDNGVHYRGILCRGSFSDDTFFVDNTDDLSRICIGL